MSKQLQGRSYSPTKASARELLASARFDIPCPGETEGNPACSCQIKCNPAGNCAKAQGMCDSKDGCVELSLNPDKSWATLKRGASDEELELFGWEGLQMTGLEEEEIAKEIEKGTVESERGRGSKVAIKDLISTTSLQTSFANFNPKQDDLCIGGPHEGYRSPTIDPQSIKHVTPPPSIAAQIESLASKSIGVVALTYNTPVTLVNSMLSWEEMGLLDVSHERLLIANAGVPVEVALGKDFDFKVVQPKDIEGVKMNPKHDNVVTIGAAFYSALEMLESEYVIFLEKDFMADTTLTKVSEWICCC